MGRGPCTLMRLRDLERALARVPLHPSPDPSLEQYRTPADVAARLVTEASGLGDIVGRRILDLGCGTGMLAIAAALAGAAGVLGVDIDAASLRAARATAEDVGAKVEFEEADVRTFRRPADVVLQNPPFGAQRKGADRPFLEAALACAPVAYTIHHAETRAFVEGFAGRLGARVTHRWSARLALPRSMRHHEKVEVEVEAVVLRLERAAPGHPQGFHR